MMRNSIQYIMEPKARHSSEIATYISYDLVAYDCLRCENVAIDHDVTSDKDLAFSIVRKFNEHQLDPVHLRNVIFDMLE